MNNFSERRVVTLLPAATEMVCALGQGGRIVGRSHECDYPAEVASLPACTRSRLDVGASDEAAERQVKALVCEGLSVFQVHADRLKALKPDVIVTQALCSVCAVDLNEVRAATEDWLDHPCAVISLEPHRLDDLWLDLRRLGDALGAHGQAELLTSGLRNRVDAVVRRARSTPDASLRRRVAYIEWCSPLMTAGHWIPELIEMAGGDCVFGDPGIPSERSSVESLAEKDPDVVVLGPCGMNLVAGEQEASALRQDPEWMNLRAAREGRVYLIDGNQYFSRPGPRLVDSLEIMAEILHPEVFTPGHHGSAWKPLEI